MRSIEATVTVSADGKLTLQLPADIPPGQHRVVLVIDSPVSSTHEIDAAFVETTDDVEYQAETRQIEAEFADDKQPIEDPILGLGSNPVVCDVADAAENHDRYIYNGF